ncbi:unnamed protein product, partial [Ascophyllum nodosum]
MQLRALDNHGENNCLFHAVSMALWGVNDRNNMLRKLASMVLESHHGLLKRIFTRGKRKIYASGPHEPRTDKQINDEWEPIWKSVMTPGIPTDWFVFFILSNILRRPVVM